MTVIKDRGFQVEFERHELQDLVMALNELEAMRAKFTYPGWANGYSFNTAERVARIHKQLKQAVQSGDTQ